MKENGKKRNEEEIKKKKKKDLASGVSNAGKVRAITIHRGNRRERWWRMSRIGNQVRMTLLFLLICIGRILLTPT